MTMYVQVNSTRDYEKFNTLVLNRGTKGINPKHLSNLKESIKEKNLLHVRPIVVDKEWTIIDGHHRLEAAKQLKLDIYYIQAKEVTYDDAIRLTRATNSWPIEAYIEFQAHHGNENYKKLKSFLSKYDIGIHTLWRLMNDGKMDKYRCARVKKGLFVYTTQIDDIGNYIETINWVREMLKNQVAKGRLSAREFWFGCYKFLTYPLTNIDEFKKSLRDNFLLIKIDHNNWKSITSSFVNFYNEYRKKTSPFIEAADVIKG